MDIRPQFSNMTTAVNRKTHRSGRLVSSRMRGMGSMRGGMERSRSNANAMWNIIEANDDENDVGVATQTQRTPSSFASTSSSNSSLTPNGLMMKPRGVTMIRKGNQLFHAKPGESNSNANCSVLRRSSSSSKYSYKLRNLLQTDLKMGGPSVTAATSAAAAMSITTTPKQPRPAGITTSLSSRSMHRRKIRKTNLEDEFSQDIQSLLKTLHSDEFVGTIHPQYHARYVSDESFPTR